MKHPILRLVLALLALAAAGGAGYYVFTLEQRAVALRTAERGFDEDVLRLQATLADLRAAQAGYLAIGQDAAVWIQKAAQLRQQADTQLRRLTAATPGPDLDADLATVGEGLASLARFDKQITELLRDEQTLTASALIFSDSAQVAAATAATLSKVRGAQGSKTGAAAMALRQQQLYAAAGAGLVVLIVLLLLVPVRRRIAEPQSEEGEQAATIASDTRLFAPVPQLAPAHVGVGADLDLALERRTSHQEVERNRSSETLDAESRPWGDIVAAEEEASPAFDLDVEQAHPAPASQFAVVSAGGAHVDVTEPVPTPLRVDLSAAARLCTDLARVRDTSELQGLLARAAALLDATGIVVWMGGSDGKVLWPAFSHGYTPHTLSKMQALPTNGGTPVSAAFRSGLMEVVPAADAGTSGAIVAPILTSTGCVGVMAVEIRHGAEMNDGEQALAGILAAQLATLVAGEQG